MLNLLGMFVYNSLYYGVILWDVIEYQARLGSGLRGCSITRSVGEDVLQDVFAHAEGFLACGLAVVVDVGVFPAVAEVAFPGEEADEASVVEEAVGARGQVVVLVDFGEAVGEVVFLVEDGVAGWQFDKFEFGEYQLHLREDILFDAVVVVDVEESPAEQVVAEVLPFRAVECHVAVAGHVDEGVVEEFAAAHADNGIVGGEVHVGVGVAEGDEVGERGGVGVPVASTAIFEEGYLCLGGEGIEH